MRIQTLKCPECMATLDIEEDMEFCYCKYCGCKIAVQDENKHTYRHIDDADIKRAEADIKRAETEQMVQLREMKLDEASNKITKILVFVWLAATAVLGIMGLTKNPTYLLFAMVVGIWGAKELLSTVAMQKKQRAMTPNDVMITSAMVNYTDQNYANLSALFRGAGFRNISEVPLMDLTFFSGKKNGIIQEITICGKGFKKGDVFDKDAPITITYHSFRK